MIALELGLLAGIIALELGLLAGMIALERGLLAGMIALERGLLAGMIALELCFFAAGVPVVVDLAIRIFLAAFFMALFCAGSAESFLDPGNRRGLVQIGQDRGLS